MRTLKTLSILVLLLVPSVCFANENGEAVARFLTDVVFPPLALLLMALSGLVVNAIRKKTGLQISAETETKLLKAVENGIAYAEEYAANKLKTSEVRLTGRDKLDAAIAFVLNETPTVSRERAELLVQAVIGKLSGPGATGPAAVK